MSKFIASQSLFCVYFWLLLISICSVTLLIFKILLRKFPAKFWLAIYKLFLWKDTSFYLFIACPSNTKPLLHGLHLLNSLYFSCFQHSCTCRSIFRVILSFHSIHWILYKLERWFSLSIWLFWQIINSSVKSVLQLDLFIHILGTKCYDLATLT